MNEHFRSFIQFGRKLISDKNINWEMRLSSNGMAVKSDAWNLTEMVSDTPPPNYWVRDFGLDSKALPIVNSKRLKNDLPPLENRPISESWQNLIKTVVAQQLFFQRNTTKHIVTNVVRPLRVIATCVGEKEPWELRIEDIVFAYEVAKEVQASGKLADLTIGAVKTVFDSNHLSDVGQLYPVLPHRQLKKYQRARFTKSADELRHDLEERKHEEKLPDRKAFWELVRIVFTEKPKTFLDLLRFAQVKVILFCGLRAGEACLLPADWKRTREYYDPSGIPAGELGGYSKAIMLRHFAEKQRQAKSDSVVLFETAQYIPAIFEEALCSVLSDVEKVTRPLRNTLRLQIETGRTLPWFKPDELVSSIDLYTHLSGNPILLDKYDEQRDVWKSRYNKDFDSSFIDDLYQSQVDVLETKGSRLNPALYVFYNRLKEKIALRYADGSIYADSRVIWAETFLRVSEVEELLAKKPTKLSDTTPFRMNSGELQAHELLFLMPKRALAEGRNDGLCDITRCYSVGRFTPEMLSHSLGGKNTSTPTLFETYGHTDEDRTFSLNTHSLRHLQNTELFRLGVADTIITKRFNRKSVAQSYEYDHRSLSEELQHIELPVDVETALGDKAATVARLIKSGKARGPIVDAFLNIQKSQGDDAAFDFLKVEADGFHSTPYGHCINSFTVDPCPKHLECFAGCRHLTATDMPEPRTNLEKLEKRFQEAKEAIQTRPATTIGYNNQLSHVCGRLDAVRAILSTDPGELVFPEGSDISEQNKKQRSLFEL